MSPAARLHRAIARLIFIALTLAGTSAGARSGGINFPTETAPDSLHLRAWTTSVGTELPPYDHFEITIENGRLTFRQGDAIQRLEDIDLLRFEDDIDVLTLFARTGDVFAISKRLLEGVVFEGPPPVTLVQTSKGRLDASPEDYEVVTVTDEKIRELRNDSQFPLALDPDYQGHSGNLLLLRRSNGRREVVHEVDRCQIAGELVAVSDMIQYLTDVTLPSGQPLAGGRSATERFRRAERNSEVPYAAVQALQPLGRELLDLLGPDREYWSRQIDRPRDRFNLKGGSGVEKPADWDTRRRIQPNDLLKLAAASLGGTALLAAAARYKFGPEYATVVHATFLNWMGLIAPVWLDSRLRGSMFRMAFWMSLIPPVAWAAYWVIDKSVTKLGDPLLTQVHFGMRAMAELNEPFWKRLAQVLRQPHLVRALSLGVNPFATVDPKSDLGGRAGLESPVRAGWLSSRADHAAVARVLKAIKAGQDDLYSLAHWLALRVIGEEQRLNAATLAALEKSKNPAAARALRFSREADRRRVQLAHVLAREMRKHAVDTTRLSQEDLEALVAHAREVAVGLRERTGWRRKLDEFGYEWSLFRRGALEGLHTYALADNRFWRTARARKATAEHNTAMQLSDHYGGGGLSMSWGPRANPNDPSALMVDPTSWLGVSRQALYGFLDSQRWYSVNNPARLARMYPGPNSEGNPKYKPREEGAIVPLYRGPGFWRGLGWWMNDLRNPSTGRYGEIIIENLRLSTQMLQASYLLTTVSRIVFAGAPFAESSFSFFLNLIAGHLWYGLVWDLVIPTNERMEQRYASYRRRTEDATDKIQLALRLDDPQLWNDGMREAAALFSDPAARATGATRKKLRDAELALARSASAKEAEQFLWTVLENPPLPGRAPKWIARTSSLVATIVQMYLGLKMDVLSFRPGLDWGQLLLQATIGAGAVYASVALLTKGWRYFQEKRQHACENALLEPELRDLVNGLAY